MRKSIVFLIFGISTLSLFAQRHATRYSGMAVDLGLPSGTKWADRNVGASSASGYGNYFSWDEISNRQWGGSWRVPSKEQFDELLANTTSEWTIINGVKGRKFTAKNGNWIFFPAAGSRTGLSTIYVGVEGNYWSRTLYADRPGARAWGLYFDWDYVGVCTIGRGSGPRVRPVRP